MKWKTKNGTEVNFNPAKYRLTDWESAPSKPQLAVQQFFKPFWKFHIVLTEFRAPKTLFRYDLCDLSSKTIVETSPDSVHLDYNEFFHGSRAGYLKKLTADREKRLLAEKNGFKFIELNDEHLNNLTKKMFKETFDLDL